MGKHADSGNRLAEGAELGADTLSLAGPDRDVVGIYCVPYLWDGREIPVEFAHYHVKEHGGDDGTLWDANRIWKLLTAPCTDGY